MKKRLAHLLVCLYPSAWKARYRPEFEAMLECRPGGLRTVADVMRSAFLEHMFPTRGNPMDQKPYSVLGLTKHATAFVPIAMSLVALTLVLSHVAMYGAVREADEGAVAHLWQILMIGQLPVIAFFAIKWLPRAPRPSLGVLALQAGAVLASMAPVLLLHL